MKVLKFGGTSVGSSKNINKIIEIVKANEEEKQIIVVSAFAKVTNLLLEAAQLASIKKTAYTSVIEDIKTIHNQIISDLFTEKDKNEVLKFVNKKLTDLKSILDSISLISDLSAKLILLVMVNYYPHL